MRLKLFPLIAVCLLCALQARAQAVDEAGSTATITGSTADISLSVSNTAGTFDARADLEFIDPAGAVRARASQTLTLKPGKNNYKILVPLSDLASKTHDDLGWFRLKYRVGKAEGIVSLSGLLKDVFDLRVTAPEQVLAGTDYRVRVRAINPFTKINVRNVSVDGTLDLDIAADPDEFKVSASAMTGRDGIAILHFKIPPGIRLDGEPEIGIIGRKNGVVRKIEEDLESSESRSGIFLTSDKPMYQPGETFNLRGLFLDASNTVVPGEDIEFEIEDEDDTTLFRQTVKTSEFGIASVSWKIPHDAKLGTYEVQLDGDEEFVFKVSRYDLPKFSVTTESDKSFYLTTDRNANITVGADYMFGKRVARGKVRVVRETERHWNWKEQRYDIDEGEAVEGETDSEGKYVAAIDLTDDIKELEGAGWKRFEDLHFTAYFTDPTTNRTEQKGFDIRLTKEPIHVYLLWYADQNPRLPMTAYVSTFYADGAPASCSVEVTNRSTTLDSLKTNSLGAGKMKFLIPAGSVEDRKFSLKIEVHDKRGQRGVFHDDLQFNNDDAVQLETDKAVYKAGDAIKVDLVSTQERGIVYVDLIKDRIVIESRHVNLEKGKGGLQFLYNEKFKGPLTVAAYTDTNRRYWDPQMRFSRGIIFPERQGMRLDARFSRGSFRPGEDANVRFSVSGGQGREAQSALGITIFDKAIEERAKTDGEYRNYFGGFASLMGLDRAFGNITLRDLNSLDVSKPVSDEMQLAAEVVLAASPYRTNVYHGDFDVEDAHTIYSDFFEKQIKPLERMLRERFENDSPYLSDAESLAGILKKSNTDLAAFRDPWGEDYSLTHRIDRSYLVLDLVCLGPDEKKETPDDFAILTLRFPYFERLSRDIDRAVTDEFLATSRHIRDIESLSEVLKRRGVDLAMLTDPWKHPYRISFGSSGRNYVIRISSLGPDGVAAPTRWAGDDFEVASVYTDFFSRTESEINAILARAVDAGKKKFPVEVSEFKALLREGGLDLDLLRGGMGEPLYVTSDLRKQYSYKQVVENGRTVSKPVSVDSPAFVLHSAGVNRADKSDDYELALFSEVLTEQYASTRTSGRAEITSISSSSAKGAIRGTITDAMGAVIPNIEVVATAADDERMVFSTVTDEEGKFLLPNLPSGKYSVSVPASGGFASYRQDDITVRSQTLVVMDVTLSVAGVSAVVDVAASPTEINQTSSAVSTTVRTSSSAKISFPYLEQSSTPRLREYFPETLLWRPELLTDRNGKAELNFKLADNITTWKMYAIASTKNGKVGVVEKEFAAFQPFFVDLDPPKFLTEGDRISLPVQVRNYTAEKQAVNVSMSKADWFSVSSADRQALDVGPGESKNAVFAFRADAAVQSGKQRVTATARKEADAIEKAVTVRPNGKEIVGTQSKLFSRTETFRLDFPANALPGSPAAQAKIYPNLFSHVGESVEGLLHRPYGCGEQTISSTYPNLMILKFIKSDTPLRRKAQDYLKAGYERLIGYQVGDGGFTYWGGKDTSNVALTAYALRFLNDVKEFVDVDAEIIRRAEEYLARVQNPDGSWSSRYYDSSSESARVMTTAYVARSMAMRKTNDRNASMQKAFVFIDAHRSEIVDPHTLALFGLALLDSGETVKARSIAEGLQAAGVGDGNGGTYWNLESSTLFYGWGTTARIETTALVVQLLTRTLGMDAAVGGTLYLLRNKDRYGVWYSTQTTINVLDALIATLAAKPDTAAENVQVFLNGASIQSFATDVASIEPVIIDLRGHLNPGGNILEIRGGTGSPLMVQTVATHYIAWSDVPPEPQRDLHLDYKCDKSGAAIMSEITCSVETGRVSAKGYGMLLAEIGLPPGADVSRESLDRATQSDSGISRYDILPDRIVIYFWSRPTGTKFNFSFRPRYGIEAQTPPSIVYDYYNPEAQTTVAPLRFSVR